MNSIKYTKKGFVKIRVAYTFPYLKFLISDSGIGIQNIKVIKDSV